MSCIRFCLTTVAFAAIMSCTAAIAQTPAPQPSKPSMATRVETWTKKQWEAAKKEWAKDRAHGPIAGSSRAIRNSPVGRAGRFSTIV
jgi:hypothetical protein